MYTSNRGTAPLHDVSMDGNLELANAIIPYANTTDNIGETLLHGGCNHDRLGVPQTRIVASTDVHVYN